MTPASRQGPPSRYRETGPSSVSGFESSFDPQILEALGASTGHAARWIGWRLRLLVLSALVGCLGVFLLARWLAATPSIDATWRGAAPNAVELADSDSPLLRPHLGRTLAAVVGPGGREIPIDALALQSSARWLVGDAERHRHAALHAALAEAYAQPRLPLRFESGEVVEVPVEPRGYGRLGTMFWLLSGIAFTLYLLAMIVLMVRPSVRNLVYAVLGLSQTGNLVLMAAESALQIGLPPGFAALDGQVRMAFDTVTGAALIYAATVHPTPLRGRGWIAAAAACAATALVALTLRDALPGLWWWVQGWAVCCGAATIVLLSWSYRVQPHPFAALLRRFGLVIEVSLVLLTAGIALTVAQPVVQQAIVDVGTTIWYVFFAAVIVLVPFLSRSPQLMREFSLLAGVSSAATAVDLIFVSVFSLGQFASLTLSLFLALGIYAGARQWILNRVLGSNMLTTERMFEQLYRIAREVEVHPESTATQLSRLLRDLFEPLEIVVAEKLSSHTRIVADGSTMLVPVPDLAAPSARFGAAVSSRTLVIRFAHRGRRLFTRDDARLTDRVVEQLRRAIAFDKAVEQGRSEERARLAQDLHDDIGARLLTLMYKAQSPEMEDYLRHTLQDLKTLTRGLAAASHRLSHAAAEWKADLTQRLALAHVELVWSFQFDEDAALSVVQWSGLTRVLRELVSNAISHAQATRVSIDFLLEDDQLDLMVSDNGHGRDPASWAHGLGIGGIRKRVKQLGGKVEWIELAPRGIACKVRIRDFSQRR